MSNLNKDNIIKQRFKICKSDRQRISKHNSLLIWFTGLSGSGKSTLANIIEVKLNELNILTYVLDGDNIRLGINKDLSFKSSDRFENVRRIAEISNLFIDASIVVLAAFVSPYKKDREYVKKIVGADSFIEVFVNASLENCEKRDVKGLYKKARSGEIPNFTGISDLYEYPISPDIEVNTDKESIEECANKIFDYLIIKIKKNG
jgi:adenylylsulfate kinase